MTVLRIVAALALLIASGVLLFIAGFGVYFAISTAIDGIGGGDEQARFSLAVARACWLPSGVAFLIAGGAMWQRTGTVLRPLLIGIGVLLLPVIAALIIRPGESGDPFWRMFVIPLVVALPGSVAAFAFLSLERRRMDTPVPPPVPVDPRGRGRRIAALIIALLVTVPSAPFIVFVAAVSFDPIEAGQEPNVWAGITAIAIGFGMVAMVIFAALALVRPRWWSMLSFVVLAGILAASNLLPWILGVVLGLDESGEVEALLLPMAASVLLLFLGWLSRLPET